ncbi:MAG: hypothetical protein JO006_18450 [Paucibacter sp.]|nr:hypothetical protein [Roseateles sp.]
MDTGKHRVGRPAPDRGDHTGLYVNARILIVGEASAVVDTVKVADVTPEDVLGMIILGQKPAAKVA